MPVLQYPHVIELPTPFPVGPITVYLAGAPDEALTLVDTGSRTPETCTTLETGLAHLDDAPPGLARIVLTHARHGGPPRATPNPPPGQAPPTGHG